ncbi:hypothetical protein FOVG_18809 [Fusarium oxysporum f. sp. pisi HDV247]|uniref:Peptidase S8/S53 domain-containing protein n=1 Tax=Fusarium oxysporum f. sp. pisi HDV247 TaxID=1080344 RepID=W9NAC4_FUSOX|nr:hypothetical protein FOVG_18809 [Fusarium oxysporum f. sp. pisi HDV247]
MEYPPSESPFACDSVGKALKGATYLYAKLIPKRSKAEADLPSDINTIQALSRRIAIGYLHSQSDAAPARANIFSENGKELPTHSSNGYRHVEMIRSDSGFPSTRIGKVTYELSGAEALVSNPERVELSHFFAYSTATTSENEDKKPKSLLPEPHFTISLDGIPENKQEYGVIVFRTTLIIHDSNPRGLLYVTLRGANIRRGQDWSDEMKPCNVHFQFDLRKDAEDFSSYVKAMQERLLDLFIQGPFYDEKMVYTRQFSVMTATHGLESKATVTVVSSLADQRSNQKLRAIITREGNVGSVCLDFKNKALEVARRGLTNSLSFMTIWLSDYDLHGKSVVTQTSWEKLVLRGAKRAGRGFASSSRCLDSRHERTAEDWRKEIDHLIDVMQDKDLKPSNYDRVKIAIIDTGLHPQEKDFCTVEAYNDFVDEGNDMRDDSWHGTCSARIILDMYEEAKLYIARVFKTDQAKGTEGPLLMAKAIEWAIESPRTVDIISISAGFRDYSKELQDAVTKASAAGVLVLAAASNWRNTGPVAYPARYRLNTICVFSTNTGDQGSDFNPEPRDDAPNFAILGEMFRHPDQRRDEHMSGTSMATAMAAGLAARILDFSRQPDNRPHIFRADDVGKLAGMMAIFNFMSKPAGRLKCVAPLKLLPLEYGVDRHMERQRVRHNLSLAMENAD